MKPLKLTTPTPTSTRIVRTFDAPVALTALGSGLGTSASSGSNRQAQDGDTVPDLAGDDWPLRYVGDGVTVTLDRAVGGCLSVSISFTT